MPRLHGQDDRPGGEGVGGVGDGGRPGQAVPGPEDQLGPGIGAAQHEPACGVGPRRADPGRAPGRMASTSAPATGSPRSSTTVPRTSTPLGSSTGWSVASLTPRAAGPAAPPPGSTGMKYASGADQLGHGEGRLASDEAAERPRGIGDRDGVALEEMVPDHRGAGDRPSVPLLAHDALDLHGGLHRDRHLGRPARADQDAAQRPVAERRAPLGVVLRVQGHHPRGDGRDHESPLLVARDASHTLLPRADISAGLRRGEDRCAPDRLAVRRHQSPLDPPDRRERQLDDLIVFFF